MEILSYLEPSNLGSARQVSQLWKAATEDLTMKVSKSDQKNVFYGCVQLGGRIVFAKDLMEVEFDEKEFKMIFWTKTNLQMFTLIYDPFDGSIEIDHKPISSSNPFHKSEGGMDSVLDVIAYILKTFPGDTLFQIGDEQQQKKKSLEEVKTELKDSILDWYVDRNKLSSIENLFVNSICFTYLDGLLEKSLNLADHVPKFILHRQEFLKSYLTHSLVRQTIERKDFPKNYNRSIILFNVSKDQGHISA